ncbi:MAG: slipin family protein [Polyangiaceae bacterium]
MPESEADRLEVPHHHVALVTKDGRPHAMLTAGNYVLWRQRAEMKATLVSTQSLMAEIPEGFWSLAPVGLLQTALVQSWERALVYVDGKLDRELSAGRYALFADDRVVKIETHSLREREIQIVGQEVMSADKATLRISVIVKYKITDPVLATSAVESLHDSLYAEAQIAARRLIAGQALDVLLEQRSNIGATLRETIAERAKSWGVEVVQIDLKDVVLPGEMKVLLNQVIEAEKQAIAKQYPAT